MFYYDDEDREKTELESDDNESVEDLSEEAEEVEEPEQTEEPEESHKQSEEYEEDRYYSRNDDVDRYYDEMRKDHGGNPQPSKNTSSNGSYVSKKTVALIVSICLVIAIICGICVGALSSSIRERMLSTQTEAPIETTAETADKQSDETKPSGQSTEKPVETSETIHTGNKTESVISLTTNDVGGTVLSVKDVYKKVNASVVIIKTNVGAGSGVVVSKDGYIITNYHVANESSAAIEVSFSDGTVFEATYILGDENSDVALLKTSKNNCVPAEIADSDQIEVGDVAIVIGNALGRGITLTSGYISALSRTISVDGISMTLLQTDATINSGNSGGGLFNEYGQLVALVNSKTGGSTVEGTGYAIPTKDVIKTINDLQTYGYITGKARLGITMTVIGSTFSSYGYIQVKDINEKGSVAGTDLKVNDILYKIGDTTISSTVVLSEVLGRYKIGDTVKLIVLRPTKDISEFKVQSWFTGTITYDYDSYVASCEAVEIEVTFVEFDPNN